MARANRHMPARPNRLGNDQWGSERCIGEGVHSPGFDCQQDRVLRKEGRDEKKGEMGEEGRCDAQSSRKAPDQDVDADMRTLVKGIGEPDGRRDRQGIAAVFVDSLERLVEHLSQDNLGTDHDGKQDEKPTAQDVADARKGLDPRFRYDSLGSSSSARHPSRFDQATGSPGSFQWWRRTWRRIPGRRCRSFPSRSE